MQDGPEHDPKERNQCLNIVNRQRNVTEDDVTREKNVRELFKTTAGADMEVDANELKDILNKTFTASRISDMECNSTL